MGNSGYAAGIILSAMLLTAGEQRDSIQNAVIESEVPESEADYWVYPLSYDLSDLPPMKNEIYAVWEDKIYYRQYSDEDINSGALWAEFGPASDTEKALICMERRICIRADRFTV